jgi:hypothetical protein
VRCVNTLVEQGMDRWPNILDTFIILFDEQGMDQGPNLLDTGIDPRPNIL